MNKDLLNKQFDTYVKKTIKNTIINYKKYETRKMSTEISLEKLTKENDISVPFLFSKNNLEDYFENEKLYTIVSKLTQEQKDILELKVLNNLTSKQIARKMKKSDSRIRHIYNDLIKEIKKKMEE